MACVSPRISFLGRKYGYPNWIIERFSKILGSELVDFLESCERRLPKSLRVNPLKADAGKVSELLTAKGFKLEPINWVNSGFWVTSSPFPIGATREYLLGYYFIQTSASMLPPIVLDPKPHEVVLDMCAAPGGKTSHISQLLNNQGVVIAIEVNPNRAFSLKNNLARCGVHNSIILNIDANAYPKLNCRVDKILLDAPCSGEGLIRQLPERKTSRKMEDIIFCSRGQKSLISAAAESLKEGGSLVYSTCSLAPEENEEVVDYLLKNFPMRVVPINIIGEPGLTEFEGRRYDRSLAYARRIYPHKYDSIGFFVCKMVREAA